MNGITFRPKGFVKFVNDHSSWDMHNEEDLNLCSFIQKGVVSLVIRYLMNILLSLIVLTLPAALMLPLVGDWVREMDIHLVWKLVLLYFFGALLSIVILACVAGLGWLHEKYCDYKYPVGEDGFRRPRHEREPGKLKLVWLAVTKKACVKINIVE